MQRTPHRRSRLRSLTPLVAAALLALVMLPSATEAHGALPGANGKVPSEIDDLPFDDIATSPFVNDIVWMHDRGITVGCTASLFCPNASVTRAQMASFLVRTFELSPSAIDYFTDDETSTHEADINALRKAGITAGCGPSRYCPTLVLTRAEAAAFVARAGGALGTDADCFTDDDNSPHEEYINVLCNAGLVFGCAPMKYCPDAALTRGQMAAFLHRIYS